MFLNIKKYAIYFWSGKTLYFLINARKPFNNSKKYNTYALNVLKDEYGSVEFDWGCGDAFPFCIEKISFLF